MFWTRTKDIPVTRNGIFAKAFRTLASGLWLTFGGMVLASLALAVLLVISSAKARGVELGGARHVLNGAMALLAGGAMILSLWGKYRCFELQHPLEFGHRLPGHRFLQIAFWSDVLGFVLKTSARTLGVAQLRPWAIPAAILSQIVFMLFLRKMADLMQRPGLKHFIDGVLGLSVGGTLAFFVALALRGNGPPMLVLALIGLATLLILVALLAYLLVLFLMARAASAFAGYLKEREYEFEDDDEAEVVGIEAT
jgi:hypothetical protein